MHGASLTNECKASGLARAWIDGDSTVGTPMSGSARHCISKLHHLVARFSVVFRFSATKQTNKH
jgi:hypothetical protein